MFVCHRWRWLHGSLARQSGSSLLPRQGQMSGSVSFAEDSLTGARSASAEPGSLQKEKKKKKGSPSWKKPKHKGLCSMVIYCERRPTSYRKLPFNHPIRRNNGASEGLGEQQMWHYVLKKYCTVILVFTPPPQKTRATHGIIWKIRGAKTIAVDAETLHQHTLWFYPRPVFTHRCASRYHRVDATVGSRKDCRNLRKKLLLRPH